MRKMRPRDLVQWISDQLLVLYTCYVANQKMALHRTRMQKIIFLSEFTLWQKKLPGLNQSFIKHKHGPFSSELDGDLKRLKKSDMLLYHDKWGYILTPEGQKILEESKLILKRNRETVQIVRELTNIVMNDDFNEMLGRVYGLPNPLFLQITVADTPQKKYLLQRDAHPQALSSFDVTDEEAESLEILLNPRLRKQFLEGEKSVREGPLTLWNKMTKRIG